MNNDFERGALIEQVLTNIRDKNTEPREFRDNLKRLGTYLIYEASKKIPTKQVNISTPVSDTNSMLIKDEIIVLSLLRAAMPMADAVFDQFNNARLGVISASRDEMISNDGTSFSIRGGYTKIPDLKNKIVIIVDPMLATGSTVMYLLDLIKQQSPSKIIFLVAIASKLGVKKLEKNHPDVEIYCAAIDEILNKKGYIVPGLGDAGDRVCNTPH